MSAGFEYSGVIHCHSNYSDGRASVEEILKVANRAGLDYLILSDHNTMAAREQYPTDFYGRVLLIHGVEITPRFNHYLAVNTESVPVSNQPAQQLMDEISAAGGFGWICHPHDAGSAFLLHPGYEWRDETVRRPGGIEIWNFMSRWVAFCQGPLSTLMGILNPGKVFAAPAEETLALWDRFCQQQETVGIGAVDAHVLRTWLGKWSLTVLPLKNQFTTVRTNLLCSQSLPADPRQAEEQVIAHLRSGRAYAADYSSGFCGGFRYWGEENGRIIAMGSTAFLQGEVFLRASWSQPGRLKVIRDGKTQQEVVGTQWQERINTPGVYRLEVWPLRGKKPWVLSNPIYLQANPQQNFT